MKKIILVLLLLNLFILGVFAEGVKQYIAYISTAKIIINGKIVHSSTEYLPIVAIDGSTYVPLRPFAESLAMDVKWNQEEQTIVISDSVISKKPIVKIGLLRYDLKGYLITVYDTGKYEISTGIATSINGIKSEHYLDPMETKYKILSEEEQDEIKDIISKISDEDQPHTITISGRFLMFDVLIGDTIYEYSNLFNKKDGRTENMQNLLRRLVELSPIEIAEITEKNKEFNSTLFWDD